MYRISHKLKLRILDTDKARFESHMTPLKYKYRGKEIKVPGVKWNELILDLRDELQLFRECEIWRHVRMRRTEERCDTKITMGEYEGLWPTICDKRNMKVTFLIDVIHLGRKDWRDWFMEGEEYASQ
jgi:hypothetical protein